MYHPTVIIPNRKAVGRHMAGPVPGVDVESHQITPTVISKKILLFFSYLSNNKQKISTNKPTPLSMRTHHNLVFSYFSTLKVLPGMLYTGTPPKKSLKRWASSVAEVTTNFRSRRCCHGKPPGRMTTRG